MKTQIYTLLFLAFSTSIFAQFGIKAGANFSKYSYSEDSFDVERKSIIAYDFGLNYKLHLSEKISLWPEILYTVKGANVYHSYPIGFTGPMKYNNKLNYLQLNLPVVFTLPISDDIDYEIGAGPFAGYMLSGKSKIEEFDGSTSDYKFDKDDFKKMDFGLVITTGLRLNKTLGLNLSYDLGLANINPDGTPLTIKNRNFSVGISWLFSEAD